MVTTRKELAARRSATSVRARLAEDLRRLCDDAGVSQARLAREAGVPASVLSRLLNGQARPSVETYARLGEALGADLAARFYPNTGPAIRDRHQAAILESLLGQIHPRWHPFAEAAVRRPARGWIDVALHEPRERVLVATEIESEIRRLEQQVRWATAKAEALPAWSGWASLGEPEVSRLLIVRWTRATREAARAFPRQLEAAYPAHPADALEALTGVTRWPGPALIWARIEGGDVRLVAGR
jgi:transcriptional regulator with XRE-family HTH domain